jgi:hypothetical protein
VSDSGDKAKDTAADLNTLPEVAEEKRAPTAESEESEKKRPASATSEISLVGFPDESAHRTLLRTVKLDMRDKNQRAAARHEFFLERSCTALERSQILAERKAKKRLKKKEQEKEDEQPDMCSFLLKSFTCKHSLRCTKYF